MIGLSVVLIGRAHYVLYILKRRNRFSTITTWTVTLVLVGYLGYQTWSWLAVGA